MGEQESPRIATITHRGFLLRFVCTNVVPSTERLWSNTDTCEGGGCQLPPFWGSWPPLVSLPGLPGGGVSHVLCRQPTTPDCTSCCPSWTKAPRLQPPLCPQTPPKPMLSKALVHRSLSHWPGHQHTCDSPLIRP